MVSRLITQSMKRFSSTPALFNCSPFKVHKCLHPKPKLLVKRAELLNYYEQMVRIRKMELKTDTIYKMGLIRGFCHLYDGQEAVAVGLEAGLKRTDHIITAYRCHAQQLLRGDNERSIFAEMMGKGTGSSKGKGGSMHMYMPENNFYGGNGIVGAQVPVGAGIALACKYKKTSEVCVAMFGDGAANQGQVFETANMAALWKLPLIFLIENNLYGMGTSSTRSSYSKTYYTRGDYVPGIQADGLDVISVKSAVEHAAAHCREGKGPIFLELLTYRYHGHSMSDPGKTYRKIEEVKSFRKERDSLKNCEKNLLEKGWATEKELKELGKRVDKEVTAALDEAMKDEEIESGERFRDVFYKEDPKLIKSPNKDENFASDV